MNDLSNAFKDAGEEAARRIRAKREAAANKQATTNENGDAFKQHIEQLLKKQREESGIADLLS